MLVDLSPPFVMAHFLLSMALLADAVVLHDRACQRGGPRRRVVVQDVATAVWVLVGAAVARALHRHDRDGERAAWRRRERASPDFFIPDVARLHGVSVMLFLALTLLALWLMRRTSAPARTQQAGPLARLRDLRAGRDRLHAVLHRCARAAGRVPHRRRGVRVDRDGRARRRRSAGQAGTASRNSSAASMKRKSFGVAKWSVPGGSRDARRVARRRAADPSRRSRARRRRRAPGT